MITSINNLIVSVMIAFSGIAAQEALEHEGTDPLSEVKKAIAESNAIYFTAFVKNDPSIFADRYAEDACILAPNTAPLCGHDAARTFFKAAYEEYGLRNGKFITTAVYGNGSEFVTEEGIWQSFNGAGELFDEGKFLVLWKKTPQGWKMFRDSFSSNQPVKPVQN